LKFRTEQIRLEQNQKVNPTKTTTIKSRNVSNLKGTVNFAALPKIGKFEVFSEPQKSKPDNANSIRNKKVIA